jgi:hypothetical protein
VLAVLGFLVMPMAQAALGLDLPPLAEDQTFTTIADTPQEITLFATDIDGDKLTFAVTSEPQHGTLSGVAPSFLYTPAPGFSGSDSFTWKAFDGTLYSNVATASISVAAPVSTEEQTDPPTLELPPPSWYTPELHQRILDSGQQGVEIPLDHESLLGSLGCLGYSPPSTAPSLTAVSAGGCMVHPHGCTMNFVFRDTKGVWYIGTAGHCVDTGGDVIMQVSTRIDPTETVFVTLAKIGHTVKKVDQGIGRDFGLVQIDPGWKVVPGIAGAAGPTGVFCGDPVGQPVAHYGHGYIFLMGPGDPKFGEVIPDAFGNVAGVRLPLRGDNQTGYNWVGYGLPGDSGSGVMDGGGLAVGDLTHGLGVSFVPIPGLSFGTTMGGIFGIIGSSYSLVTADGRNVQCPGSLLGLIDL